MTYNLMMQIHRSGLIIYILLIKIQKLIFSKIKTGVFNEFSYNFMIFNHLISLVCISHHFFFDKCTSHHLKY
jgi:hypothetical protein